MMKPSIMLTVYSCKKPKLCFGMKFEFSSFSDTTDSTISCEHSVIFGFDSIMNLVMKHNQLLFIMYLVLLILFQEKVQPFHINQNFHVFCIC